jgi:hypothetical protein
MSTLRAAFNQDGTLVVSGGSAAVRCYGWVDVDQDEALSLDTGTPPQHTERGHSFVGTAELEGLRVAAIERLGGWTALILPRGSRLIVAEKLVLPPLHMPATLAPPPPSIEGKSIARTVARAILALVLLDLFGR